MAQILRQARRQMRGILIRYQEGFYPVSRGQASEEIKSIIADLNKTLPRKKREEAY